ncbi:YSIRK-type signal peptide-containing protein, partial [Streptococcus agalactiae]
MFRKFSVGVASVAVA